MKEEILLSVCMPIYNDERTIEKAVTSILNQTYQNFELIISDNCSTDQTYEILKKFKDPRITLYQNEKNIGWRLNSNKVFSRVNGKYIVTLHGDDFYARDDYFSKIIQLFEENSQIGVVHVINSEDRDKFFKGKNFLNSAEYYSLIASLRYMPAPPVTSFRSTAIKQTQLYSGDYWTCEARLSLEIANLGYDTLIEKDDGFFVRFSGEGKDSQQLENVIHLFEDKFNFLKEHLNDQKINEKDLNDLKVNVKTYFDLLNQWYQKYSYHPIFQDANQRALNLLNENGTIF